MKAEKTEDFTIAVKTFLTGFLSTQKQTVALWESYFSKGVA
jgi:hypothetical protein